MRLGSVVKPVWNPSMSLKIALISTCADTNEAYKDFPREIEQIKTMMQTERRDWSYHFYDIFAGQFPDIDQYDGFVVSGSPSSVNDPDAWVIAMLDYIRQVFSAGKPMVGICYGHQAIAKALGGEVSWSPLGWSIGVVETAYRDHADWMEPQLPELRLFAAHNEQVLKAPEGAAILASTPECPIAAFRIGNQVFATQHHPEMGKPFVAHILKEVAPDLNEAQREKFDASMVKEDDSKVFAGWMAQFIEAGSLAKG